MFYYFCGKGKEKKAPEKKDPFSIVPDYRQEEGSNKQRCGSGSVFFGPPRSGSFYHQAKIVRKP
jgi:hypothetical protein